MRHAAHGRAVLATYRVQLTPTFGFDDAAAIVPQLARLGITHLYTSPHLQAAPGSTHGYDVVDPTRVNQELGGEAGYRRLVETLHQHGLGLVPDVVPNHMAIGVAENRWWWDVLENGPASRYAPYFDVDWDSPVAKLRDRVLVPVLGDHYGRVLEAGELQLRREGASFVVAYAEHSFPLAPRTLDRLLKDAARRAGSEELAFLADAHGALPLATAPDEASRDRRHRDKEVLADLLERLLDSDARVAGAVDTTIEAYNADADRLDALLERQNYRLAYWRTASQELDYRRFFDITTLAALRADRAEVFRDVHRLVLEGYRAGEIDGFRVDHPDGLLDPDGYAARLRAEAPDAWVVVEKILEPGEQLPRWPVDGTTGYDGAFWLNELLVDPRGEAPLTELYRSFTGDPASSAEYEQAVRDGKRLVLRRVLAADLNRLVEVWSRVCEEHRRFRDFTRPELRGALEAVAVHFPVYRTYVRPGHPVAPADVDHVRRAVTLARAERTDLDGELFDLLEAVLLLEVDGAPAAELAVRFQQFSSPVMAKGVEDTAFYRYHRLVSLNEVGGDPGCFGVELDAFHEHNRFVAENWPATMVATSTHDTKRSEDVRARLALLAEIPDEWAEAVGRWAGSNERHRRDDPECRLADHRLPDRGTEYLLYQTLVGAHPVSADRILAYLEKATREAKRFTSWTDPDPAYDEAVASFASAVLADGAFLADLERFVAPLVGPGRVNGLTQSLLKLTMPGVPDVFQGAERWVLSLVDPDNRRAVDFSASARLLDEVDQPPEALLARADEGLPKLAVHQRALQLRRRRPECFLPGPGSAYRPLPVSGPRADHVVAYGRGEGVAVVASRFPLRLAAAGGWSDTTVEIGPGRWRDEITGDEILGGTHPVQRLLARFPVALLSGGPS
jgi:(1->4)-alpha-D-glucan 1-alpha-D-glucosylmutase